MADDGDALRIHVLAIRQQLDRRAHIVGVVGERRRLGASAALADAAFVVADDDVAGVGEGAGDLAEDRNAEGEAVAIGRAAAADQDDGRQTRGACLRRFRQRSREREAVARDVDLSSFGREIATLRDETAAMSSRTTSSDCAGTLNRIIRPVSSVQRSASRRPPGSTSVIGVRRAVTRQASRRLNLFRRRLADGDAG